MLRLCYSSVSLFLFCLGLFHQWLYLKSWNRNSASGRGLSKEYFPLPPTTDDHNWEESLWTAPTKDLRDISNELSLQQTSVKKINGHAPIDWITWPLTRRAPWQLHFWINQAHCGTFFLGSCLHGAIIWLQVGGNLAAQSLKNFCSTSIMLSVSTLLLPSELVLFFSWLVSPRAKSNLLQQKQRVYLLLLIFSSHNETGIGFSQVIFTNRLFTPKHL